MTHARNENAMDTATRERLETFNGYRFRERPSDKPAACALAPGAWLRGVSVNSGIVTTDIAQHGEPIVLAHAFRNAFSRSIRR